MSNSGEPTGFFATLTESFRTHIEDRIQSPFAGAFLIAWAVTNWKALLILVFSAAKIEERIATVSSSYFSSSALLWLPLLYTLIGVLGYYIATVTFQVIFECYGILKRRVERGFDRRRWVSPQQYMEFKKRRNEELSNLSTLASDNLQQVDALKSEKAHLEAQLAEERNNVLSRSTELEKAMRLQGALEAKFSKEADAVKRLASGLKDKSEELAELEKQLHHVRLVMGKIEAFLQGQTNATGKDMSSGLISLMRPGQVTALLDEVRLIRGSLSDARATGFS